MTTKVFHLTVVALLLSSDFFGFAANAHPTESGFVSSDIFYSAKLSIDSALGSSIPGNANSGASGCLAEDSPKNDMVFSGVLLAQDIAGPPSPGGVAVPPTATSSEPLPPGMVPYTQAPANAPASNYPFLTPRQAAAASGIPTASQASPAAMNLSTPPVASELERANRQFSATIEGSMCFSCLVNLRNQLRGVDGVRAIDIELHPRNASMPSKSKRKTATLNVFYEHPRIDANELIRLIKSRDFNMLKVADKEFRSGGMR